MAAIEGGSAFSLLVLPGPGTSVAAIDPATLTYRAVPADGDYFEQLAPLYAQALPDAFTLFDTSRLRPALGGSRAPVDPGLLRMVHGYDAILILSGSTPSRQL
jgi:hypothetical protein